MIPPAIPSSISDIRREDAGTDVEILFYPGDHVQAQPIDVLPGGRTTLLPPVQGVVDAVRVFNSGPGGVHYDIVVPATPGSEAQHFTSRSRLMTYLWGGKLRRYLKDGIAPNFQGQDLEERLFYIRHGLVREVDPNGEASVMWTPWMIIRALMQGKIDTFQESRFGKDIHNGPLPTTRLVGLKLDNEQAGQRVRRATLRMYRFWWWRLLIDGAFWYKSPMNPW